MSKRLQVVLDDAEYRELERQARKRGETVSQLVRDALRAARRQEPSRNAANKLSAVREAARHAYETGDIEKMLGEIEAGYLGDMR